MQCLINKNDILGQHNRGLQWRENLKLLASLTLVFRVVGLFSIVPDREIQKEKPPLAVINWVVSQ